MAMGLRSVTQVVPSSLLNTALYTVQEQHHNQLQHLVSSTLAMLSLVPRPASQLGGGAWG